MTDANLLQRLDRIESRSAIEDLCGRYCIACDGRDLPALAECFTPDIVISSSNGSMNATGLENVIALYDNLFKVRGPGFHWSHDRMIRFDDNDVDSATGLILAHAETCPAGQVSIAGLRYTDSYRRVDGHWLFASRVLDFVYYVPMHEYIARFPKRERVLTASGWTEADFPEGAPSWDRWHTDHCG